MSIMLIEVTGRLRITRLHPDLSDDVVVFEDHNLITSIGREVFSRMLGDNLGGGALVGGDALGSISEIAVSSMVVGNNPGPSTPNVSDTSSSYAPYTPTTLVMSVSYPDAYSVMFTGTLATTDGNSVYGYLTEEALYLRTGALFARRVFQVAKTSAYALRIDHTISFQA